MRIFVAGATGALGRQLLPQLVANGHEVTGTTRSRAKADEVRLLGARPAVMDALDPDSVARAVAEAEPEVIVHELTALSGSLDLKHFDRSFAQTNRLRRVGTNHLLAAGRAAGISKFVIQSYAGWPFARVGGPVKTEEDPLDPSPPKAVRETIAAIKYLEQTVTTAMWTEGIVLRYGGFYGPGTSFWPGGEQYEAIENRKFPVVGSGDGILSLIHVEDGAAATVAAVERAGRGIYNVVDDNPQRARDFLPEIARVIGAKPPWHVPRWLGRLVAGQAAAVMMTEVRGASNAKAKRELGWRPRYPSWREGFAALEGDAVDSADQPTLRAAA
jgi:nucleoside-diphosphate-sugar epimerase